MGDHTGIECTEATWNPVTGCTQVSAGCDNCYAKRLAQIRLRDIYLSREPVRDGTANRADPFAVRLWPERLSQPARWSQPRRVFVNSMSDLFHKGHSGRLRAPDIRGDAGAWAQDRARDSA